jgi:uncharacterized protein YneF (UPF0154 family)
MKGVVVQVGEPKSIVLLNNGRITAIPTPADCHVGMVITVKYSNLFKIIIIFLAAVLLLALGIFIGAYFLGSKTTPDPLPDTMPWYGEHGHMRMMEQRR